MTASSDGSTSHVVRCAVSERAGRCSSSKHSMTPRQTLLIYRSGAWCCAMARHMDRDDSPSATASATSRQLLAFAEFGHTERPVLMLHAATTATQSLRPAHFRYRSQHGFAALCGIPLRCTPVRATHGPYLSNGWLDAMCLAGKQGGQHNPCLKPSAEWRAARHQSTREFANVWATLAANANYWREHDTSRVSCAAGTAACKYQS